MVLELRTQCIGTSFKVAVSKYKVRRGVGGACVGHFFIYRAE